MRAGEPTTRPRVPFLAPRALRREGLAMRILPFAIGALLSIVGLYGLGVITTFSAFALTFALTGATALSMFMVPWTRLPKPLEILPPLAYVTILIWIREHTSQPDAALLMQPLFLFSLLGVALYGTRGELAFALTYILLGTAGVAAVRGFHEDELPALVIAIPTWSVAVFALNTYVGRQVQAERTLAGVHGQLSAALEKLEEGVVIIDSERRFLLANPAYARMFVLPPERLPGLTRDQFIVHLRTLTDDAETIRRFEELSLDPGRGEGDFTLEHPARRILHRVMAPLEFGYVVVWRDVTAERDLVADREHQALSDALTGLGNRRAGTRALEVELARARRSGTPLAIALLDIDHFKRINDTRGHAAGDDVLRAVAAALLGEARVTDTVVRWGGEEFLAVLPGDAAGARAYCERARRRLPDDVTLSAGVAEVAVAETAPFDGALGRADAALYEAKRSGRDRVI